MRARTESCTCPCCHSGLFSMVDRIERLLGARNGVGHRYLLVCENCGAESAPFFIMPAGDMEGTVTGKLGQVIEMDKLELVMPKVKDEQLIGWSNCAKCSEPLPLNDTAMLMPDNKMLCLKGFNAVAQRYGPKET